MNVFSASLDLVGNTPVVELKNLKKELKLKSNIFAKIEGYNPAGSSKDRIAKFIIEKYEEQGLVNKNTVFVEATSGNTGIGIAFVCAAKGYKAIIVMPDNMSVERIQAITAFGATVVLTPASLGMQGAVEKAEKIKKTDPNAIIFGQFKNPLNPLAHYFSTGPEIMRQTKNNIDVFVAGIGTGGTISGTGKFLKEQNRDITVVGVEPESSPLLTKGYAGAHKIQGIGANFVPDILDRIVIDDILTVSDEDAYYYTNLLAKKEGILAGISSGCALKAAIDIAKKEENKNIVVLFADSGNKYFSTGIFE
ncbi:MAG: cysteine synthase A [Clostridiales bacterium]|nr:cysteine synthase A [Clostridiales bacterium]